MTIQEKYNTCRPLINNGDIILIRGKSWLAKTIQWADSSYWNHALVVYQMGNRLLAIQSMAKGVEPDFLSKEIFDNVDFCIVRPIADQEKINACVDAACTKAEDGIPYNNRMLPKILIQRKLGWDIKKLGSDPTKNICSVFAAWTYGNLIPLSCYSKENIKQDFITPQDIIRFADPSQVAVLATEIPK